MMQPPCNAPSAATATLVTNPWDPFNSRRVVAVRDGGTVRDAVRAAGVLSLVEADPEAYSLALAVNGRELTLEEAATVVVRPGDSVVCALRPRGGGGSGKNVLAMVAMIAIIIVAAAVTAGVAGLAGGLIGGAMTGFTGGATMAGISGLSSIGITAGWIAGGIGGAIMGAKLAARIVPGAKTDSGIASADWTQGSSTYSWDSSPNVAREATTLPVLYGTVRVCPPIIGQYMESEGTTQAVNILYALADHEVDVAGDPAFPAKSVALKAGVAAAQGAVTGTAVLTTFSAHGLAAGHRVTLSGTVNYNGSYILQEGTAGSNLVIMADYVAETIATGAKAIRALHAVYINDNHYSLFTKGGARELEAEFRSGTLSQTAIDNFNQTWFQPQEWSAVKIDMSTSSSSFSATRTMDGDQFDTAQFSFYFPSGLYAIGKNSGKHYGCSFRLTVKARRQTGVGQWGAWETWYDKARSEHEESACRIVVTKTKITAGTWEVTVGTGEFDVIDIKNDDNALQLSDCYWEYYQTAISKTFAYPGTALLGLRAMATDQLSGGMPRVTVLLTRATVKVYVPAAAAWQDKPADNPAWAAYDMLANTRYGGNVDPGQIIYDDFASWADWCDEKGLKANVYYDQSAGVASAISDLSSCGRAAVVLKGCRFGVVVDKPGDPVQLFTVGNIVKDSFKITYLDMQDRANAVEISILDAAKEYRRNAYQIRSPDWDEETDADRRATSLQLIACTSRDQAIRHGRFMLKETALSRRVIEFQAAADAIACVTGDIILVAHDVTKWAESGRLTAVSADRLTLTLDRAVTWSSGATNRVLVRRQDTDDVLTVDATSQNAQNHAIITLATALPEGDYTDAVYAFGAAQSLPRKYRVVGMVRAVDTIFTITAADYHPEIYDDDIAIPEEPASTAASAWGLALSEIIASTTAGQQTAPRLAAVWCGNATTYLVTVSRGVPDMDSWIPVVTDIPVVGTRYECEAMPGTSYRVSVRPAGAASAAAISADLVMSGSPVWGCSWSRRITAAKTIIASGVTIKRQVVVGCDDSANVGQDDLDAMSDAGGAAHIVAAAKTISGSTSKTSTAPYLVRITAVGHGLYPGQRITITGTTNYNGSWTLQAGTVGDYLYIPCPANYVAETFGGSAAASRLLTNAGRWYPIFGGEVIDSTAAEPAVTLPVAAHEFTVGDRVRLAGFSVIVNNNLVYDLNGYHTVLGIPSSDSIRIGGTIAAGAPAVFAAFLALSGAEIIDIVGDAGVFEAQSDLPWGTASAGYSRLFFPTGWAGQFALYDQATSQHNPRIAISWAAKLPHEPVMIIHAPVGRYLVGSARNAGGGLVGLPIPEEHPYAAGDTVTITGTTNYNGDHLVQPGSTSTEILITAAYTAETMASPTARSEAWYAIDTSTAGSFLMHTTPGMRRQLPVLIQAAATTSFRIPLRQGWNMVTLPAVLDLDSVSQFADVFGPGFVVAYWFDPLLMGWIVMDNVSDLPPPGTGMMVYINGTPAAPLIEGQRITCPAEFPVRAGFNLVGVWADTRVILPDKHNLVAGDIVTLNAAGNGNDIIANGDIIPKGTAFWIQSKAAGTVIFA